MVDIAAVQNLPIPIGDDATFPGDIPRLENGWWPSGGIVDPANDSGIMNWQSALLAERTEWLKHRLGGIGGAVGAVADLDALAVSGLFAYTSGATGNPAAGTAGRVTHTEGDVNASQMVMTDAGAVFWRTRTGATWGTWSKGWAVTQGGVQSLVSGNGYERLPSGNIIQWGRAGGAANGDYITFPIAFPNEVYGVTLGDRGLNTTAANAHILGYDEFTLTLAGFDISVFLHDGTASSSGYTFIAIGR